MIELKVAKEDIEKIVGKYGRTVVRTKRDPAAGRDASG